MIDPIEPVKCGTIHFAIDGVPFRFPAEMIPKLFVAYVAAQRAEYYAGVDAARCDTKEEARACFEEVFHQEIRHATRDRFGLQIARSKWREAALVSLFMQTLPRRGF